MNTRAGATNSAICVDEPIAISSVTSTLFLRANSTAEECSAAFPMIGITINPTKSSESPSVCDRRLERPDEELRHQSDQAGGCQQDADRLPARPRRLLVLGRRAEQMLVRDQREGERRDVEGDQHGGDRAGDDLPLDQAVVAAEREQRRHQQAGDRQHERGRVHRGRAGVVLLLLVLQPAEEEGEAQHEQQVPQDRAGQRCLHDLDLAFEEQEDRDDQLGDVAERGVDQSAEARTDVQRQLLGGAADQSRERQDRAGRRRGRSRGRVRPPPPGRSRRGPGRGASRARASRRRSVASSSARGSG